MFARLILLFAPLIRRDPTDVPMGWWLLRFCLYADSNCNESKIIKAVRARKGCPRTDQPFVPFPVWFAFWWTKSRVNINYRGSRVGGAQRLMCKNSGLMCKTGVALRGWGQLFVSQPALLFPRVCDENAAVIRRWFRNICQTRKLNCCCFEIHSR